MAEIQDTPSHLEMAADIVSAFVSHNSLPASDLPGLLASVNQALNSLASGSTQQPAEGPKEPAVPVKKSVQPDYIVCLEDGKKFKSLKRHLRTVYDLTPDQYRAKWGLPPTYPMVAPNYAAARSELAKKMGLGQQRRRSEPAVVEAPPSKGPGRGRGKKAACPKGASEIRTTTKPLASRRLNSPLMKRLFSWGDGPSPIDRRGPALRAAAACGNGCDRRGARL